MNTRIALYCRVSTDSQDNTNQRTELAEYVRRRGWVNVVEYLDTASGARNTRPALDRMISACRGGKIDTVVCVRLDRLGRSLVHLATLLNEFERLRVALICTAQGIDTSEGNPAGRFQAQVLGAVAEYERAWIVERVKAGLKTARANGVRLGRLPLNESLRGRAVHLRKSGFTFRFIALELGISTGSAVNLCR